MPFTGNATFANVSRRLVRITGLSLAAGASGTIGLDGDVTADEQLPDQFNPTPYADIDLAEAIEVSMVPVTDVANGMLVRVTKALAPFQITLQNDDGMNASPELEIWVRYH